MNILKTEAKSIVGAVILLLGLLLVLPITTQSITNTWYKSNSQYLIGPIVNATLIYCGLRLKSSVGVFGIVLLPSLCAVTLGLLGINAIFMMYMIPFIWIGNMAIVFSFRFLSRYSVASIVGIGLKISVIFGGFFVLQSFGVFPSPVAEMLWTMMGIAQLITATCGAVIAYGFVRRDVKL